ncbi:MAG: VOC family protein [Proteobacteria bacterium]|nr:VOC family protein [Pseudomonadota bacterium]
MFTGLHHTALITRDMAATTRFWRDAMGLPLTSQLEPHGLKHWFFELTPHESIAFFEFDAELPEAVEPKRPGVVPRDGRLFDHLAIGVADVESMRALQARLEQHGVAVRGPVDHEVCLSIYFEDPNGISVEVCV